MSVEAILNAVRALPPEDKWLVFEEIGKELGSDEPLVTDADKEMIDRRLAAHRANPTEGRPFEEVLDEIEAKLDK